MTNSQTKESKMKYRIWNKRTKRYIEDDVDIENRKGHNMDTDQIIEQFLEHEGITFELRAVNDSGEVLMKFSDHYSIRRRLED